MKELEFILYNKDTANHFDTFLGLLSGYFDEICFNKPENNIPKKYLPRILSTISDETKKYTIWAFLCVHKNNPIGFVIAQIDTKDNPLCKRVGWGFIREFYIIPEYRRRGYATEMSRFIEHVIYQNGAENIYLTADSNTGEPFWESMGYLFSGECDDTNGNKLYEKCPLFRDSTIE